ncbi:hypothetical protein KR009_005830 [Drosophila setifemur]|nr:hypothetical protein KR009_005830 [Drosophila setifemur]
MANRTLWTLLLTLAALQCSCAAPMSPKMQLSMEIFGEFMDMMVAILEEAADQLQRIIDDAENILPDQPESHLLTKFKEFVNLANSMDIDDSFEMTELIESLDILEVLDSDCSSNDISSEVDQMFMRIVEEHGGEDLEQSVANIINKKMGIIIEKMDAYISTWPEHRRARKSDFINMFNDIKNEKDAFEKLDKWVDFDLIYM